MATEMEVSEAYGAVRTAWVERRLENVMERQKQLFNLHAILQRRQQSFFDLEIVRSKDAAQHVQKQLAVSFFAISEQYQALDFPASLAIERKVRDGHSDLSRRQPVGPVLIIPAASCPISSVLLPLSAAIAAGSAILIATPVNEIYAVLGSMIAESLDFEAVKFTSVDVTKLTKAISSFTFGTAVLQDEELCDGLEACLRQQNPNIWSIRSATGMAATIIDRSASDFQSIARTVLGATRSREGNQRRVARIVLIDEFVIKAFVRELEVLQTTTTKVTSPWTGSAKSDPAVRLADTDISSSELRKAAQQFITNGSGMLLVPTRSLDHAIDLLSHSSATDTVQALYIFSAQAEASYLAAFLSAQHTFINDIPWTSSAVSAPRSSRTQHGKSIFHTDDFSELRSVVSASKRDLSDDIWSIHLLSSKALCQSLNTKKIKQAQGGRLSYFEQGLIVGLVLTLSAGVVGTWLSAKGVRSLVRLV
ncbi:Hypothetical protein D9617_28g065000 [Elsinoe fawcettii]|nr:Hypothetical protein D9617_28g065000 [Elsinoe fawcettii]